MYLIGTRLTVARLFLNIFSINIYIYRQNINIRKNMSKIVDQNDTSNKNIYNKTNMSMFRQM